MAKHRKHAGQSGHAQEPDSVAARGTLSDAIAHRAYELFQDRGREPGRDLDDWLRAEQEVRPSKGPNQPE